jgi:hypothetical protein
MIPLIVTMPGPMVACRQSAESDKPPCLRPGIRGDQDLVLTEFGKQQ